MNNPIPIKNSLQLGRIHLPKWILFSMLTILLYGLMGVVAKFASNSTEPLLVQVISSFGMIPLLIMLVFSRKAKNEEQEKINIRGILFSILVGILASIAAIAQFFAFSLGGPASIVVPVVSLASLVTVILARFFFNEKLNRYQLIGLVFSIVAILMFNVGGGDLQEVSGAWWKSLISSWMLFSLLGLFSSGMANLFIKSATNHVSSDLVTIVVLSTIVVLTVILIFTQSFSWHLSLNDLIVCLVVGILGSTAFLTQTIAYSSGIVSLVTPLSSLFPVVTVVLSVLFLGEKLTLTLIIAVLISAIAGIALSIEKKQSEPGSLQPLNWEMMPQRKNKLNKK